MTVLPVVLVAALLANVFATAGSASASMRTQRISHAMSITRHQKGDPYSYGAHGPNRFDCSGLIYYSYRKAGFRHIPRTASEQARHMNRIPKSHLRRGDLVFFYSGAARAGNVYHVGVYAGRVHGHRTIIHAPHSGSRVHREAIWTHKWFAGTLRGM
ncbi:MAG: C40 family peptidase [Nocardioidaceae bacterium]